MNNSKLERGTELRRIIEDTEKNLKHCQFALRSIEKKNRGSGELSLKIPNVPDIYVGGFDHVSITISDEQMTYALILAEKKIQKQLDQLTQEFEEL